MNFVALDFETANECADSVMSIGLTTVSDGKVVASAYHLIRPPELRLGYWQAKQHRLGEGLGEEDVRDSPNFGDLWPSIRHLIEGNLIVAHNADSADMRFLRGCLQTYSIDVRKFTYLCSLALARRAWPELPNHGVKDLAAHFSLKHEHHNAASDARVAAEVVLLAAEKHGYTCPLQLANYLGVSIGEILSRDECLPCSSSPMARTPRNRSSIVDDLVLPDDYDISQHPFFGKNVLFTGMLQCFSEKQAGAFIARFGGNYKTNFTKKIHYLVIGTVEEGYPETRKPKQARKLKEDGGEIQIISEAEFLELLFSPVMPRTEGE